MTLHPQDAFSIPEETVRVAHAAYPKGNVYIKMRDALGTIYQDQTFAHLFPHNGRSVEAPWRLALITVMQFMEELPDRQAADAVRGRIDWKYALLRREVHDDIPGAARKNEEECSWVSQLTRMRKLKGTIACWKVRPKRRSIFCCARTQPHSGNVSNAASYLHPKGMREK